MKDEKKIRYLTILKVYDEVLSEQGENAPYILKNRLAELTINRVKALGLKACRSSFYDALNKAPELKRYEYMLK